MDLSLDPTQAAEAIKHVAPLVARWLPEKLAALSKDTKLRFQLRKANLQKRFEEYLTRTYSKHSFLSTLALRSQQCRLVDIYVPLTLQKNGSQESLKLVDYRDDFLPAVRKILVTDAAGMGKSTVLKYLFLKAIEAGKGIPVFLELRKLTDAVGPLEAIAADLSAVDEPVSVDVVRRLLRRGDFIIFLDGYDEIPFTLRASITTALNEFIGKASNNVFMMTSRPEGALAAFPEFVQYSIQPLRREEAFWLLKRYDPSGEVSTPLIEKVRSKEMSGVSNFLTNPLLVSLLFKAYQYKASVPLRRSAFYRQVFQALFEEHDLSKGGAFAREKLSRLDMDGFERVLRRLAYETLTTGTVEYEDDEILSCIRSARKTAGEGDFKESDFLKDLLGSVPLFVRDGGRVRWSHKSLQEYFAAAFICYEAKDVQVQILEKMLKSDSLSSYVTTMVLCNDLDPNAFHRTVIVPIAREIVSYAESSYQHFSDSVDEREIDYRRAVTWGAQHFMVQTPKGDTPDFQYITDALTRHPDYTKEMQISMVRYSGGGIALATAVQPKVRLLQNLRQDGDGLVGAIPHSLRELTVGHSAKYFGLSDEITLIGDDPRATYNGAKRFEATTRYIVSGPDRTFVRIQRAKEIVAQADASPADNVSEPDVLRMLK